MIQASANFMRALDISLQLRDITPVFPLALHPYSLRAKHHFYMKLSVANWSSLRLEEENRTVAEVEIDEVFGLCMLLVINCGPE